MIRPRYLTKSRFKVGLECSTKLYYLDRPEYGNAINEDPFMQALADGGFQVGALAKFYYPGGVEVETLDTEKALQETDELLLSDQVTIYEAAFRFQNLLIRADIVVKNGNQLKLIEVKAKSYDINQESPFYTQNNVKTGKPEIHSRWRSYLMDVAFQKYVITRAQPDWIVSSHLLLADVSTRATVDGLNQKFVLGKDSRGRAHVQVDSRIQPEDVGQKILIEVNVDPEVEVLWGQAFELQVQSLAQACVSQEWSSPALGGQCKNCEFRIGSSLKTQGLKSGFENCWSNGAQLTTADFARPFVFDVWNIKNANELISKGKIFADQLQEADIAPQPSKKEPGLSSTERQWLQVQRVQSKDPQPFVDRAGLRQEMQKWKFPLHFIDFETAMVSIPFHAGRRPYEQIAFQFSHHEVSETSQVAHADEYIHVERGKFPNFDFLRALQKALTRDQGTIFRYSAHENTVLLQIHRQLVDSTDEILDRDSLLAFIESITLSRGDVPKKWKGPREMVDLFDVVKKYFYHPRMGGSNSIKKVLPAVLHERGRPTDLYGSLNGISDGGQAATAYARMQFTQISETEVQSLCQQLLRYCELDTYAMVLIYEYFRDEVRTKA